LTVFAVVLLIALLILLIGWGRVPPFAAFIAIALTAALCFGMPLNDIGSSLEHGVGDMLGGLTAIICFGAMFGRIIADSGAARSISTALIGAVGDKLILIALALTGLIVGIPLFYSVGFVVLVPLLLSLGPRVNLPSVQLGIPLVCGLSIAHGFLPPHPAPIALIKLFGADIGLTLIYGLIVGGVALMVAGPLLALTLKNVTPQPGAEVRDPSAVSPMADALADERLPGAFNSCFTALLPVLLISASTAFTYIQPGARQLGATVAFIGQPTVVLLVSLIYATFSLGVVGRMNLKVLMQAYGASLRDVSAILLILAGAGALKQVFVDSGVSEQLAAWLQIIPLQPLILGWLIATAIRIALGSATIAGLTAASIMAPIVTARHVDPNLMVLSIGAGSLMCSHVNDAGFWLFKEYFNLSLRDTFRSWTLMESLAGSVGLLGVLVLNVVVPMFGRP
jgi:Gnt-I system high-affinity gluconate transporter